MTFVMKHYISKDKAGNIHIQNAVMGQFGQHHVHTPAQFRKWSAKIDKSALSELKGMLCDCGMKPGEMRDGR